MLWSLQSPFQLVEVFSRAIYDDQCSIYPGLFKNDQKTGEGLEAFIPSSFCLLSLQFKCGESSSYRNSYYAVIIVLLLVYRFGLFFNVFLHVFSLNSACKHTAAKTKIAAKFAATKPLGEQPEEVVREIASRGKTTAWKVLSEGINQLTMITFVRGLGVPTMLISKCLI